MAFPLAEILGGGLGKLFKDVVGTFKADPTEVLKMQSLIEQNQQAIALKELEIQARVEEAHAREIEAASKNIQAEAQSGDKYTSRARPTFLYVSNFIIAWNYVIAPLIGRPVLDFPEPLFWLFGSVMLGYVGARSWEKFKLGGNGNDK